MLALLHRFTIFGAQAPRDGVVLGFGANTRIAERTALYLRYDGDLAGGNTNHGDRLVGDYWTDR